jgi:hypothetical protein
MSESSAPLVPIAPAPTAPVPAPELPGISADDVAREATRLLAEACAKHGISTSEITPELNNRAYAEARALLESRARHATDPYALMYQEQRRRADEAEAQLAAIREQRERPQGKVVTTTLEAARARVGLAQWS